MPPAPPQSAPALKAALSILQTLRSAGYQAYLAGGCVRDLLLGREPKDYDIATSATPDVVLNLFPRTFAVGARFGVVLVAMDWPEIGESGTEPHPTLTEVATFRSDGDYSDGRHPNAVRYTLSAEEDVQRRDFTINGLLLDIQTNPGAGVPGLAFETWDSSDPSLRRSVIDYVNGLADLRSGLIRAIGSPTRRFEEDHLRMLRAIRFAARFEFQIDPGTRAAIGNLAAKIQAVSRERVRDELTRMLTEGHARRAFELLDENGLLPHVLPEVAMLRGVQQPPQYHPEGDVWTHTLLLLSQLEAGCSMTLAWAALLHDIGKPATFQPPQGPGDRIRFNGHVEVGVAIARDICNRLRFSNEETTQIQALVHNHMRFADIPLMKTATLKRFLRLDRFPEHLALHKMDCQASSLNFNGNLTNYHFAKQAWESTPAEAVRPKPLITGRELIALGYHPGPAFKTILHAIDEAQLEGTIHTAEEAVSLIQEQFEL